MTRIKKRKIDRFMKYVNKIECGCWRWTGHIHPNGYGQFDSGLAHRFSYEYFVGKIPDGLQIDHLCRNRWCVNPEHLEPVTYIENQLRSPVTILSSYPIKTHCKRGHKYDESNTRVDKKGHRHCNECDREDRFKYYDKIHTTSYRNKSIEADT